MRVIFIDQVLVFVIVAVVRARQKSDKVVQLYIHERTPVWMRAQEVAQDTRYEE